MLKKHWAQQKNSETISGVNFLYLSKLNYRFLLFLNISILKDMLFSFGKNASTNVLKTATQLKDAIEKTVIYLIYFL